MQFISIDVSYADRFDGLYEKYERKYRRDDIYDIKDDGYSTSLLNEGKESQNIKTGGMEPDEYARAVPLLYNEGKQVMDDIEKIIVNVQDMSIESCYNPVGWYLNKRAADLLRRLS